MNEGTVLIIGAGGVGSVTAHKCAMNANVFKKIHLASRTIEKPNAVKASVKQRTGVDIATHVVDADEPKQVIGLIEKVAPEVVINLALPYQDLAIMEACLATGVHYIDTANYESKDKAHFEYKQQWAFDDRYKKAGVMAVLGAGFDPGVTNAYCAYALKKYFDTIRFVDIMDANAGAHEKAFATNFNPEINIREVTQIVRHFEHGKWVETPAILDKDAVHFTFDYPVAGCKESYLLYHEEMESLARNLPGLERMRFWMTFSENYLTHLRVIRNIGLDNIQPIDFKGQKIVPMEFLKALLPDPAVARDQLQRQDRHRLHHHRPEGRQGKHKVHLQCLRPRGNVQGSRLAGDFLHRGRAAHGCGHDGHARALEGRRRLQCRATRSRTLPRRRIGERPSVRGDRL